jgi:hypothetical protein
MKLLLASDLHYITNLADEIATNQHRLPANTYNHQREGKLYWHNQMMVESGEQLLDGLEQLARQEQPDLLVFLGDMVNINWEKSVAAVAARFARFPCTVRQVTGNHDIYLRGVENRLQEAVTPGTYETGMRHETVGGLGLIYLDLFAKSAEGNYRKWGDPQAAERIDYRPQDIAAALALMAAEPEKRWLIFGHFPFVSPDTRVDLTGRKMGRLWPSTATLAAHLEQPNNLLGIICGHQHFAHHQFFAHGFHWTLPSLVEYPCAAAVVEWDGESLQGRIVAADRELAATSLRPLQESWTEGDVVDQQFVWRAG